MDKNISAEIKGDKLVLTINMENPPKSSKSGKTLLVATSHGNQQTELKVQDSNVIIGLNAYIKKKVKSLS